MLRATLILGLAVAALATTGMDAGVHDQIIRLGSIGTSYSFLKGILVPYTKTVAEGIPAYELRSAMTGTPMTEEELLNFRCFALDDTVLPLGKTSKPVFLCRSIKWTKDSITADKFAFLFSSDDLKTIPEKREIDLWFGKTIMHNLKSGMFSKYLDDSTEHVVRIGSIGSNFAHLKGLLVPYTGHVSHGIPAFELKSMVGGIAKKEESLINFRCKALHNFYVPIEATPAAVYMCRYKEFDESVPAIYKKTFLFSAEHLNVEPSTTTIDLWLGKSLWSDFVTEVYTTAFNDEVLEHAIRIGSIGTHFADLKGIIVPHTKAHTKGIPSYEVKTVIKGVPVAEEELINFRCHVLEKFFVPVESVSKPVLLCRSINWMRDIHAADKMIFLFSAEDLNVPLESHMIDLWLGRTMWNDFSTDIYSKTA